MKLARALALLVAAGMGAVYVASVTRADSASRLRELQRLHDDLHGRLDALVARDPTAGRALADSGQIVMAVRAGVIEEVTARVARQYLRRVTLDLTAVEAHADGAIRKDTLIGRRKVGEWAVVVVIKKLAGELRVGEPRLRFARNALDVALPLEVQPASGEIGLHFSWDAAPLVNLVCKDFQVDLDLDGRVLRQRHTLRGQIELTANDDALAATPMAYDRAFPLKIDLTPDSWGKVAAALRSQNTLGRCGAFLHPERVLQDLHALVAEGVKIRLPGSIFRPVRVPARFEQAVKVNDSVVRLSLTGGRLQADESMLWSSTRARVASVESRGP